jgi:alkanesulfonate monooxygenase SsuD/methylene tetrahydromethanopterin reductase-like flavin-dependent oxidoreductase (luciferase family)
MGLPYVFADFINSEGAHIADLYRERFAASDTLTKPKLMVATWAVCADSQDEAEQLSTSSRMAFALLRTTGKTIPVPTIETATRFLKAPSGSLALARRRRMTLGPPDVVKAGLESVAVEYGADELMIVTITHSHQARRRSYQLIAEAFGLAGT